MLVAPDFWQLEALALHCKAPIC